jgi:hypothetical protein
MATNEELVAAAQELYVSYYGRPADPEGLAFWIEEFTESDNVDQVLVDFGTSEEYLAILEDAGDNEGLINNLYQFMFNRDADEEGLAFYTELLDSGEASLASIALDIANGAINDDRTILDNKVGVANGFTADVEASKSLYQASDIPGAQAVLAVVDLSDESVADGTAASTAFVANLPAEIAGGEYTLDEDNDNANFSAATSAVTVTLDGDSDEARFDVVGSTFDDTFILEEYKTADIDGNTGIDTIDFSGLSGFVTASLLADAFTNTDGTENFLGTMTGVENVIGSDGDDIITGDSGDNAIWSGEGNDTVKGGLGDDTFYYEDESDLGTTATGGTADGQSGDDTINFSKDTVDLSGVLTAHVAVENLVMGNIDEEDETTLTVAPDTGVNLELADFDIVVGSAATDTIELSAEGSLDLSDVVLEGIEVVKMGTAAAAADVLTIGGDTAVGTTFVGFGAAALSDTVAIDDDEGEINLGLIGLSGFAQVDANGGAGTDVTTVKVSQATVNALFDESAGATTGVIGLGQTGGSIEDILTFTGNIDLTSFDPGAALSPFTNALQIEFGDATNVLIAELAAYAATSITGTDGIDTLVIEDTGSDGEALAGVIDLKGIENVIFDVLTANAGTIVTIDEGTLDSVETIDGKISLVVGDSAVADSTVASLVGVQLSDVVDLSSAGANEFVALDQGVLDAFITHGAGGSLNVIAGGPLAFDDDKFSGTTLTVATAAGADDTVEGINSNSAGAAVTSTFNLGGGNNTFTGTGLTVSMTDGLGASTSTDGANFVQGLIVGQVGVTNGALTTGRGNDTVVGYVLGDADTGVGDDSFTGHASAHIAGAGLNMGAGNDTFISLDAAWALGPFGASTVNGGSGNDTMVANIPGTSLTGGTGKDVFTVSAKTFSAQFVSITAAGSTATSAGAGIVIADLNSGEKDTLQIDLLGEYTMGTGLTTGNKATTGTFSVTSALASALTSAGGLKVLNQFGSVVTIAPGEALGATVLLPAISGSATGLTAYLGSFTTTASGQLLPGIVNETYVVFGMTAGGGAAGLLNAFLVTANSTAANTVNTSEVAVVTIASITATDGVGGADIILI